MRNQPARSGRDFINPFGGCRGIVAAVDFNRVGSNYDIAVDGRRNKDALAFFRRTDKEGMLCNASFRSIEQHIFAAAGVQSERLLFAVGGNVVFDEKIGAETGCVDYISRPYRRIIAVYFKVTAALLYLFRFIAEKKISSVDGCGFADGDTEPQGQTIPAVGQKRRSAFAGKLRLELESSSPRIILIPSTPLAIPRE